MFQCLFKLNCYSITLPHYCLEMPLNYSYWSVYLWNLQFHTFWHLSCVHSLLKFTGSSLTASKETLKRPEEEDAITKQNKKRPRPILLQHMSPLLKVSLTLVLVFQAMCQCLYMSLILKMATSIWNQQCNIFNGFFYFVKEKNEVFLYQRSILCFSWQTWGLKRVLLLR